MTEAVSKKTSLFSAIGIGVGGVVGSGWLFASYYTVKIAGTMSILAWVVGGILAMMIALLLGEIAAMYHERGLFSRLISISHNRDAGFVFAISNWLALTASIPSEAVATVQYLTAILPQKWQEMIYPHHNLSLLGLAIVVLMVFVYGIVNYWGIKALAKTNNIITSLKIIIPAGTAIILMFTAFHPSNFSVSFDVSSVGISQTLEAVVAGGIFYAFFGFNNIALFASEIENPSRNIPLALISTICIALFIYILLQVAFIGAIPSDWLAHGGWSGVVLSSPLAQLLIAVNVNFWAFVLYVDSALSPSGTGIVYMGGATRNLTGMARDAQVPKFFDSVHPVFNLSRRSLFFTGAICLIIILFFKSWQQIMILTTVFQLLSCVAVPVSFSKLRDIARDKNRPFKVPFGRVISLGVFLLISYFMIQLEVKVLFIALLLHALLFVVYITSFYKGDIKSSFKALESCASIFVYMIVMLVMRILELHATFFSQHVFLFTVLFLIVSCLLYRVMLAQKDYFSKKEAL